VRSISSCADRKSLHPQFPVALHAVISFRHEAPAFLALYQIDRHLFPAVPALCVGFPKHFPAVGAWLGLSALEQGGSDADDQYEQREDETDHSPEERIPAFLQGDNTAEDADKYLKDDNKPIHVLFP